MDGETHHCIPFHMYQPGLQGAIQGYISSLGNCFPAGPTHFADIMKFVNTKQVDHDMYYKVMVIITDGNPQDMRATIEQIVLQSFKKTSFLIISVSQLVQD